MRYVNKGILSGAAAGNIQGSLIDANQLISASFHAHFDGAHGDGVLKIQASNDSTPLGYQAAPSGFAPTNWVDIPPQTVTIEDGVPAILTIPQCSYRWLRAVWISADPLAETTITVDMDALSV